VKPSLPCSSSACSSTVPATPGNRVAAWSQSMSLLLTSGVSVAQAIELTWQQTSDAAFRQDLDGVLARLMAGRSLSQAMAEVGDRFPPSLVEAVRAGERSGRLDHVLARWSRRRMTADRLGQQVRAALVYPACVLVVTAGIFGFLLTFVVPKLVRLYAGHGAELPGLLTALLTMTSWCTQPAALVGLALAAAAAVAAVRRPRGRELLVSAALRLPLVGGVLKGALLGGVCAYVALFVGGGLPVPRALELCGDMVDHPVPAAAVRAAAADVTAGRDLGAALAATGFFPEDVLSLVDTGARTNELEVVLEQAAQSHDHVVETGTSTIVSFVEPALLSLMGAVVAVLVVTIYLPLLRLTTLLVR